jgi:hypothetical protein
MQYTYYRWADRSSWLAAADSAGWDLDHSGSPLVEGVEAIAGLAPSPEGEPSDTRWHLVLATSSELPEAITSAEQPTTDAPFWWSGVPREVAAPVSLALPDLTARQLRLGLLLVLGMTAADVESLIESIPDATQRQVAHIEWEYATTYVRTHPLITTISSALGLTDAQIDSAWVYSASL